MFPRGLSVPPTILKPSPLCPGPFRNLAVSIVNDAPPLPGLGRVQNLDSSPSPASSMSSSSESVFRPSSVSCVPLEIERKREKERGKTIKIRGTEVKGDGSFCFPSTHLPSLQTGTGGARNIGNASAVHSSGRLLAGASFCPQTGRAVVFVHARGSRPIGIIIHLSTDFEIGHPLSGRHPRYVNLLERCVGLASGLRVLLEVDVLVRVMVPRFRVASRQVSVGMGCGRGRQFRPVATLETHVLVRVFLVSARAVAILRVASLQHGSGSGATSGGRIGVQHVLVHVLLALIVAKNRRVVRATALRIRERFIGVGQRAAAIGRIRHAALRQRFEIVVERVGWKRGRLAGIVAISVEVLTARRGQRAWNVEIGRVVLLREHLRHAQSFPLPNTGVYLAELAS